MFQQGRSPSREGPPREQLITKVLSNNFVRSPVNNIIGYVQRTTTIMVGNLTIPQATSVCQVSKKVFFGVGRWVGGQKGLLHLNITTLLLLLLLLFMCLHSMQILYGLILWSCTAVSLMVVLEEKSGDQDLVRSIPGDNEYLYKSPAQPGKFLLRYWISRLMWVL